MFPPLPAVILLASLCIWSTSCSKNINIRITLPIASEEESRGVRMLSKRDSGYTNQRSCITRVGNRYQKEKKAGADTCSSLKKAVEWMQDCPEGVLTQGSLQTWREFYQRKCELPTPE